MKFKKKEVKKMYYFAVDSSSLLTLDSKVFIKNKFRKVFPTNLVVNNYNNVAASVLDMGVNIGLFVNGTKRLDVKKIAKKHNIEIFGVFIPNMLPPEDLDIGRNSFIKNTFTHIIPEMKQEVSIWNYCRRDKKYNINKKKIIRFESFWFYFSLMDRFRNIDHYTAMVDIPDCDLEKFLNQYNRVKKLLSSSVDLFLSLDISKLKNPKEIYLETKKNFPGSIKMLIIDWDDQVVINDEKVLLCKDIKNNTEELLIIFKFNPKIFNDFLKNIRNNIELIIGK